MELDVEAAVGVGYNIRCLVETAGPSGPARRRVDEWWQLKLEAESRDCRWRLCLDAGSEESQIVRL